MSYRDDHEAALARIANLEAELARRHPSSAFTSEAALATLCDAYVSTVMRGATEDPLVAIVEDELALAEADRPAFRHTLANFVAALRVEGEPFTPAVHAQLERALRRILDRAAVVERVIAGWRG